MQIDFLPAKIPLETHNVVLAKPSTTDSHSIRMLAQIKQMPTRATKRGHLLFLIIKWQMGSKNY